MWNNIETLQDPDGLVTKFVFTKADAVVETVLYRYPSYEERTVICHSVMSGCPMGCRFCGAGDYFVRNLTKEEMLSQVHYALSHSDTNPQLMKKLQIMSMSMGEPMLNKEVGEVYRDLHLDYPFASLLLSTSAPAVGYEWFFELAQGIDKVGLQFSVHESTDVKRNLLIPFEAKLTLKEIANKGRRFYDLTGRKPFFNYCAGWNNSDPEDAERLYELFDPAVWNATVSVICERNNGLPASNERQRGLAEIFSSMLVALGFDVRTFDPAGQDTIGGGCGQLWFVQDWMNKNPGLAKPSIGFGKDKVHPPKKWRWER
jgi:23S rRNA (adenine2503-C2)-methyltransferase